MKIKELANGKIRIKMSEASILSILEALNCRLKHAGLVLPDFEIQLIQETKTDLFRAVNYALPVKVTRSQALLMFDPQTLCNLDELVVVGIWAEIEWHKFIKKQDSIQRIENFKKNLGAHALQV